MIAKEKTPVDTAVPFFDLTPSHAGLKDAIARDLALVVESCAFINGPQVAEFEGAYAAWCGAEHCVGVASGLDALRLGLAGLGVQAGDEVLVPANTFAATFEAVLQVGATPVPVDASESDLNIDLTAAAAAVGPATRAIIPVHLYGQMADMAGISNLASKADLLVLEDACQSHGAARDGVRPGELGHAAAFSFYPAKNLGAFGDAGALVTADARLAETVIALREHGQREKYIHELVGYTARLDTLQAVVLLHKLARLDEWNAERRELAAAYTESLAGFDELRLPPVPAGSQPVWHLYVVRTNAPDELAAFLRERGIGTGRHYPEPAHTMPAFAGLGYRDGDFPVAEQSARQCLSLPIFPGMTVVQVETVVAAVREYFGA